MKSSIIALASLRYRLDRTFIAVFSIAIANGLLAFAVSAFGRLIPTMPTSATVITARRRAPLPFAYTAQVAKLPQVQSAEYARIEGWAGDERYNYQIIASSPRFID